MDFDKYLTFDYFDTNGIGSFIKYLGNRKGMLNSTIAKQIEYLRASSSGVTGKDTAVTKYSRATGQS